MTGIAVSQQIGMLSRSQPIVVFDKEAPKKGGTNSTSRPNSTDLPNMPSLSPKAATFAASPLGIPQHDIPPTRRSLAQAPGRLAVSNFSSNSRASSSSVRNVEAADAAAFRASLRNSRFAITEAAAASTSSLASVADPTAASVSASAVASVSVPAVDSAAAVPASDAYALRAPSASCKPLFRDSAASSASTPEAVALAASSMLFKSSSLLAPTTGWTSLTASSGASRAAGKAPSPLLASYLKSMARQLNSPQSGPLPEQPASAVQHSQADDQLSHAQAESHKLSRFGKVQDDGSALSTAAPNIWSNRLFLPHAAEAVEGAKASTDSAQADLHSDSRISLLPKTSVVRFDVSQSGSQLQSQIQTPISTSDAAQLPSSMTQSIQPQPMSQEVFHAEADWDQHKRKTSMEFRHWAVEQSRKQQSLSLQGLMFGMGHSLEMQRGHRNRSVDLARADVKNMRLSFDSASLPKDEKLRCVLTYFKFRV